MLHDERPTRVITFRSTKFLSLMWGNVEQPSTEKETQGQMCYPYPSLVAGFMRHAPKSVMNTLVSIIPELWRIDAEPWPTWQIAWTSTDLCPRTWWFVGRTMQTCRQGKWETIGDYVSLTLTLTARMCFLLLAWDRESKMSFIQDDVVG
jgi:hypothetical protein